ncbi:MAG: hypothetical protein WCK09_01660 [Bacteroidota bacterium]
MKISGILLIIASLIFIISGCKKEDESGSTTMVSQHNETESHNNGKPCQSCHASGGSGKGWFGVAGSVYTQSMASANANGNIFLFSGPNGTGNLVATIEIDGKGNFYTTGYSIPATGVYAQVKGTSGSVQNMSPMVTSGNCNACHGVSTEKIWVN